MKVQGSLKEKKMPDHFYLKEKFQAELSLGCVKFFFSVFVFVFINRVVLLKFSI